MRKRSGFTIIETSLVLAIAGLILLMAFIALPALQRSQRDARRREDISLLLEKIKDYQQSNRGALPSTEYLNKDAGDNSFRAKYLGNNFRDPDGEEYNIRAVSCDGDGCNNNNEAREYINKFDSGEASHLMLVVLHATCDNQKATLSSNPRKVAVMYKLEVSGVLCENT